MKKSEQKGNTLNKIVAMTLINPFSAGIDISDKEHIAFTEKSVPFVNEQIMLENLIISVKKELLAPQLNQNAKNAIGYAVHNWGVT